MEDLGFSRVPFDWEHRKDWLDLPFPIEEYQHRVVKLRQAMRKADLQSLVIHGGPGWLGGQVRYISNFPSDIGNSIVVVPIEGELMLTTDSIFHSAPIKNFYDLDKRRSSCASARNRPESREHRTAREGLFGRKRIRGQKSWHCG